MMAGRSIPSGALWPRPALNPRLPPRPPRAGRRAPWTPRCPASLASSAIAARRMALVLSTSRRAHPVPGGADGHRRHSARRHLRGDIAAGRCRRDRDPGWATAMRTGSALCDAGGGAGGGDGRRAARPVAVPVAAAGPAGPARECDDPGEGADPGARAFRGLGVLRQAHAGATRGLQPPVEPGHAHLRPGAERASRW